jgi:hypothetical protein
MGQILDVFKKYGGAVLLGIGVVGLVVALLGAFWLLTRLVPVGQGSLPLLAIGGVVVLIFMLTAVAMIFSILGLTNPLQAMGLPEGSIRAVIALSLIVLFAILSVFLYQGVSVSGPLNTVANLSDTERAQFLRDHAAARDIQSIIVKDKDGQPLTVKDKDGQPLMNTDGAPKYFYDVSYRSTNLAADDFAKQLLVLLGTLMTAITSFYLGAGTATSAAAASQTGASGKPTITGVNPPTVPIANGTVHLDIAGTGLNIFTNAKIVKGGVHILGTSVSSNASHVLCDINVSAATAGTWDVVLDDGGSNSVTLPDALTLT